MTRAYNFCAGPAALPAEVLEQARDEMLDWQGRGLSVMEMSHRGEAFMGIAEQAEKDLRELMNIPDDYAVLFLQGGASTQFSALPLNLAGPNDPVDYVNTGVWSRKAIAEAGRMADVKEVASSEADGYTHVPDPAQWQTRITPATCTLRPTRPSVGWPLTASRRRAMCRSWPIGPPLFFPDRWT